MAAPRLVSVTRVTGGASLDNWLVPEIDNPLVPAETNQRVQGVIEVGLPLVFRKIAATVTDVNRDYPYDGSDPTVQAATSSTVDAHSSLPNLGTEYVGMYVAIVAGTGAGQLRRISGYADANKRFTVTPNWSTTPDGTSKYRVLIPCWGYNRIHVKAEFQNAAATTAKCTVALKLFGDPPSVVGYDTPRDIPNLDINDSDNLESGFRHGRLHTVESRGAAGAKVRLTSLSGSQLSLWAGST